MSKKRLFVAIELPQDLRTSLELLQEDLKPLQRDAKWVKVDNIHLTLKFLGYVEEDKITPIEESLANIAKTRTVVEITAKGCGFFPNARRPNVLWAGVEAPQLIPLQAQIEDAMEQLGFERENRPYSPHLTLARFKKTRGPSPGAGDAETFRERKIGKFTAESFSLYESVLTRESARYTVLRTFPLQH